MNDIEFQIEVFTVLNFPVLSEMWDAALKETELKILEQMDFSEFVEEVWMDI
jgi:hypothetical protein